MTDAIFSIRPAFSQAILNGIKKVELRTKPPKKIVDCIWIYETVPTKAIVGYFVPGKTYLPMQWRALRETFGFCGLIGEWDASEEREAALVNVFGDKLWSAISVAEAHRIAPLDPRDVWQHAPTGWKSPQSWRYLEEWEAARLKIMAREIT